jgi:ABC-type multidrug transport system permease subunit
VLVSDTSSQVFYRERSASMYNPFAYGIAISLVELPYLLFFACIFMPITYWCVSQGRWWPKLAGLLVALVVSLV